jgi:hypothetical protein
MRRFQLRWLVGVAAVGAAAFLAPIMAQAHAAQVRKTTVIRGHIVRLHGADRFVVRTPDRREVILHVNPQTRFLLNNRAARLEDLREGARIAADFDIVEDRHVARAVTINPAEVVEPVPAETVVEGTIVRVMEPENQFVVRTAAGKEVILAAQPRATFTFDDRSARLVDLRPGMAVRAHFDVRERRNIVRSVVTVRRPR